MKEALDAYHVWFTTGISAELTELGQHFDAELRGNSWYRISSALSDAITIIRDSLQLA